MKRFLLIESDTEYHSMFCTELEKLPYDAKLHTFTYRELKGGRIADSTNETFFGKVRAMLVTADDIENAKPIQIERCYAAIPTNATGEEAVECGKAPVNNGLCKEHQEEL